VEPCSDARDPCILSAQSQRRYRQLRFRHHVIGFLLNLAVGSLDYFLMEAASIENATVMSALLATPLAVARMTRRAPPLLGWGVDRSRPSQTNG
jgi:hypothetical protein